MTLRRDQEPLTLAIVIDTAALGGRGRGLFFRSGEGITPADVNRMARFGGGVVSAALAPSRAFALGLSAMVSAPPRSDRPYFIASVEAAACTETGISAAERALTIATLARPDATADDFKSPGHVMPLVVPEGASEVPLPAVALAYAGQVAASAVVAWCDILDARGEVADTAECRRLAEELCLPVYVRKGDTAVELGQLAEAGAPPGLPVRPGGLDIGQFA